MADPTAIPLNVNHRSVQELLYACLLSALNLGSPEIGQIPLSIVHRSEQELLYALKMAIDALVAGGGGVWGTITGTLSAQTDLQTALNAKPTAVLDTDGTLAANSDARVASQKAVVTYVSSLVAGVLKFKGSTDCSGNPNYPAATKGDAYVVTVAGKIGGASGKIVEIGDTYVASADNAGGTEASVGTSWFVLQANITGITSAGLAMIRAADAAAQKTLLSLNLVENTALSTWAGSANVTTLGTIGTGVWQGSQVQDTYIASATNWNSKAGLGANTFTALQTIAQASANAGILASTGYSLTGSNATSMFDLAGTWNTSGTPTAIKLNLTDTSSNAAALFADFQVGGVSKISLGKTGVINVAAASSVAAGQFMSGTMGMTFFNNGIFFNNFNGPILGLDNGRVEIQASIPLGFNLTGTPGNADLWLSRKAAGSLRIGKDSATPIAQILGACDGSGSNIAGASLTITSGNGTGTGGSGSIIFQTAPAAGSSSTANTLATALSIDSNGKTIVASGKSFQLGNAAVTGLVAGALSALTTASIVIYDSTGQAYRVPCVV